jgi:uncharacterized repeat protein (TIGR03803 family)
MKRLAISLFLLLTTLAYAGETVLYTFQGGMDGYRPNGPLVADTAGNLYGTTFYGGDANCQFLCGTVFELSPDGHRGWTETVLYRFTGGTDGQNPYAGLILDTQGNLFGTTLGAGAGDCVPKCGSAFELSPGAKGWTFTLLHAFEGGKDGGVVVGGLTSDPNGNLYGTTESFGPAGYGTVFRFSRSGKAWAFKTVHAFGLDQYGAAPQGPVVVDTAGIIYGATVGGGAYSSGVVYSLTQNAKGHWTEKVLHSFPGGKAPGNPIDGLSSDSTGSLYGIATNLADRRPLIYQLSRNSKGKWTETTIYNFHYFDDPGVGNVFINQAGSAFGFGGAVRDSDGSIYELSRSGHLWTWTLLYNFQGFSGGINPAGSPIVDGNGNIYGVTDQGGSGCTRNAGCGTVFEFTP